MGKILDNLIKESWLDLPTGKVEELRAYAKGALRLYSGLREAGCPVSEYISNEDIAKFVDEVKDIERELFEKEMEKYRK